MPDENNKYNTNKEIKLLLKALLDDKEVKDLPTACNDEHLLLDARIIWSELSEANKAAKNLITARANSAMSANDEQAALDCLVRESRDLSRAIKHLVPELANNPYVPTAIAFEAGIDAFIAETEMNPFSSTFDDDLVQYSATLTIADNEASAILSAGPMRRLGSETGDAIKAVEAVISALAIDPVPGFNVLRVLYNKSAKELNDIIAIAAEIGAKLSDTSDPFFIFLSNAQTNSAPVLADISSLTADPSYSAPNFDNDLAVLLSQLETQKDHADKIEDIINYNNVLGKCGYELIHETAHND